MKNLFFLSLLALLATTMSCELLENDDIFPNDDNSNDGSNVNNAIFTPCEEDDDIAFAQLPASIQQYLAENYPNATFNDIERINGAEVRFGIEIEQGATDYEILFSADGTILSEGDEVEDTIIDAITLPVSTLEYLDANFPGVNITSAESDGEYGVFYYEVYLANGVELYFAQDGSLLCQDDNGDDDDDNGNDDNDGDDDDGNDDDGNDDDDDDNDDGNDDDDDDNDGDDDDDNISLGDLPVNIVDYLNSNYGSFTIESVDLEDLCDGTIAYEIELENGPGPDIELYFNMSGELLFVATEINSNMLPSTVVNSIEVNFAGYTIENDDIYKYELIDGSLQYEVELESNSNDIEVVFDAEGNVICTDD